MNDYKVIKFNNGDSIFCIVQAETEDTITVIFPMLLKEHSFVVGPNVVRETYSASNFCPFTDDKMFSFYKPELIFIKPMNSSAIPYYIGLLNKHENVEILEKYNLQSIITRNNHESRLDDLAKQLGVVVEDEEEVEVENQLKNLVRGNNTMH